MKILICENTLYLSILQHKFAEKH